MTVSAHDVARELTNQLGYTGEAKLHKLLYYCQGYHCAWVGHPMFQEEIEAWGLGPVVADVWRDRKYDRKRPPESEIDEVASDIITFVVETYGHLNGKQLIVQTHSEAPWQDVYTNWLNEEITRDSLVRFFSTHGARGATLHWLERYRNDPTNGESDDRPDVSADLAPDSLDDLRNRLSAISVSA